MARIRMTRAQLDEEIQALIAKKEQLADDAVKVFEKSLFTKNVRDSLSDYDNDKLREMSKAVAGYLTSGDSKKITIAGAAAKKSASGMEAFLDCLRTPEVEKALKGRSPETIKTAAANIEMSIRNILERAEASVPGPAKQSKSPQGGNSTNAVETPKAVTGNIKRDDSSEARVY